jgi:hypothetical protein
MKKSKNKTLQYRKLVLRREAVVSLTAPQLDKVVGGGDGDVCSWLDAASCTSHSDPVVN